RHLVVGQLTRVGVLFENRRIAPAAGAVELRDYRRGILDAHLPYAVLVAVQRQQPSVRPQPAGSHGVEHEVGGEARIRRFVQCGATTSAGTTAMVMRDTHTSRCRSSSMRISHTWVLRPVCSAFAVPVTVPSRTPRT